LQFYWIGLDCTKGSKKKMTEIENKKRNERG